MNYLLANSANFGNESANIISIFSIIISIVFSVYTIISNRRLQKDINNFHFKMEISSKTRGLFYKTLAKNVMQIKEKKENTRQDNQNLLRILNECRDSIAYLGVEDNKIYSEIKKQLVIINEKMVLIVNKTNVDKNKEDMMESLKQIYTIFDEYYSKPKKTYKKKK